MADETWVPKTQLGKMVASGEIKTISEALRAKLPLKEYQIVDYLVPNLKDEVIDIERAQICRSQEMAAYGLVHTHTPRNHSLSSLQ